MKTRRSSYAPTRNDAEQLQKRKPGRPKKKRGNISERENREPDINTQNENLNQIYHNIKSTPSYSRKIIEFLRQNPTSSLHKQVRKKFPTRRIVVYFPYQTIMSDLIDYSHHKMPFANNGYRYIMVFVCCFSKMAWAEPLRRKTGIESALAIEKVLQRMKEVPQNMVTDKGLEYYDHRVRALFTRFGINHYSITGRHKACIAERFIRTLKGRFEKYFWYSKKKRWIDVLQQFIDNYNQSYHRSIKMAPDEVNENNREQVFKTLFPNNKVKTKPRLKQGDRVRILKEKNIFEKGYTRSWSIEIYKIREAISENNIDYYKVEDLDGNILSRHRYFWELNLVAES